jgi:hypothetical protein
MESGPPWLYENSSALPEAFVAPRAVVTDATSVLDMMHSPAFDPQAAVLLESAPQADIEDGIASRPTIVESTNEHIVLDAEGPGWLLLAEGAIRAASMQATSFSFSTGLSA